jgi:hypothetical protein
MCSVFYIAYMQPEYISEQLIGYTDEEQGPRLIPSLAREGSTQYI